MPRVNPLRSLANERNLAARIAFERQQPRPGSPRGWSLEGLADRMTKAGIPMQRTTIYKIEKGDPPRRITVDELVGFAEVFGVDPGDLLVPVPLVHERRVQELWREGATTVVAMRDDVLRLRDQMGEIHTLVQTSEGSAAHRREVKKLVDDAARRFAGVTWEQIEHSEAQTRPWPEYVDHAWTRLLRSIDKWAKDGE